MRRIAMREQNNKSFLIYEFILLSPYIPPNRLLLEKYILIHESSLVACCTFVYYKYPLAHVMINPSIQQSYTCTNMTRLWYDLHYLTANILTLSIFHVTDAVKCLPCLPQQYLVDSILKTRAFSSCIIISDYKQLARYYYFSSIAHFFSLTD